MIERKFIRESMKEYMIQEFITKSLKGAEHSHTKLQRTPLGEKVVIYSSRPGLVVGRKGQNIKQLTKVLKKRFNLENPQIEISEVESPALDAGIMAERVANFLERFGTTKFKSIGHKVMTDVMNSQAMGIEIVISGKIPSSRAKTWRFYQGYLKKCGDIALTGVHIAYAAALLKSGIVGIKVSIMPPNTKLPDDIIIREEDLKPVVEELPAVDLKEEEKKAEEKTAATEEKKAEKKEEKPKKARKPRKKKAEEKSE